MLTHQPLVLSTAYNASILWYSHALNSPKLVIENDENFPKQTHRNRMEILGPNGKQCLSIPIVKAATVKQKTKDVLIAYQEDWQKQHWKSIETAYNSSPYFMYYKDYYQHFYEYKMDNLLEFNTELLKLNLKCLKISKDICFTDSFEKSIEGVDLRFFTFESSFNPENILFPKYIQVFASKFEFVPNLSILDLLFNLGPDANAYLVQIAKQLASSPSKI